MESTANQTHLTESLSLLANVKVERDAALQKLAAVESSYRAEEQSRQELTRKLEVR